MNRCHPNLNHWNSNSVYDIVLPRTWFHSSIQDMVTLHIENDSE
jgi:hypothetical protein